MTIAQSIARPIVSAGASPVTGGGGGGAASLDIKAKVGTSTSPTSTGTKAVTGVGFQPKVVLPFGSAQTAIGSDTPGSFRIGAAISTSSRASVAIASGNAVTTSATQRRHTNAGIVTAIDSIGSVWLASDLSSLDANAFTLNWSTIDATARILNHICLGGNDLEVSLVQCQMNGTNAAQSFAHGLSGAPTGVLFIGTGDAGAPPVTTTVARMQIGAWAGGSQFGATTFSSNGVTTTATRRGLFTDCVQPFTTSAIMRTMAVSSVDATNVNVTYPVTGGVTASYFWMLCIRGAKCQVGTFNTASSNTIVTTGLTPKLFLPVFVPTGVGSVGTVLNDLMLTIGASDGTNNVSCGISDENGASGVSTTNARRAQSSTTLCEYNTAGTKSFEATAAFSGQSVVVTPTTALTNFGEAGYLIVGS